MFKQKLWYSHILHCIWCGFAFNKSFALPIQIVEIAESLNLGQRENIEAILQAAEDWNTTDDEIKVAMVS